MFDANSHHLALLFYPAPSKMVTLFFSATLNDFFAERNLVANNKNERVFLCRDYGLIVSPWKCTVLKSCSLPNSHSEPVPFARAYPETFTCYSQNQTNKTKQRLNTRTFCNISEPESDQTFSKSSEN